MLQTFQLFLNFNGYFEWILFEVVMELTLLTSGLIQGPYILKTEFFKPWETSHWPFIYCVSEPTLTLSGSLTFRPCPASTTRLSTLKKMKFGIFSQHKQYMMSSASIRTQLGSMPISTKSSRWAAGNCINVPLDILFRVLNSLLFKLKGILILVCYFCFYRNITEIRFDCTWLHQCSVLL